MWSSESLSEIVFVSDWLQKDNCALIAGGKLKKPSVTMLGE
jgi:hypothetical protein